VPYLKSVLGFLGLTDVRFVYAEGLAMGPEAMRKGFAKAEADLDAALA
jgi:FMN-dependent NADH-azoreductase